MRTSALFLAGFLVAGSLAGTSALAVDNVTSRDAPDLTSVRAKIKAKDFQGAIAELTPMLVTNQAAPRSSLPSTPPLPSLSSSQGPRHRSFPTLQVRARYLGELPGLRTLPE